MMKKFKSDFDYINNYKTSIDDINTQTFVVETKEENNTLIDYSVMEKSVIGGLVREDNIQKLNHEDNIKFIDENKKSILETEQLYTEVPEASASIR
jgi:hypothetical protein